MKSAFSFWQCFDDKLPFYLRRYYWWAYLWQPAIWFFDHQSIINRILFGQYQAILQKTLQCLEQAPTDRLLQLSCVYGSLTPCLLRQLKDKPLYLIDVAMAQLKTCRNKLSAEDNRRLITGIMNTENLAIKSHSFSTIVIFFLLHEMPAKARQKTFDESLRILAPGGQIIITEYAEEPVTHWIYRLWPLRKLLLKYEPFLHDFWQEDLQKNLLARAAIAGKPIKLIEEDKIFNGFYRLMVFQLQ